MTATEAAAPSAKLGWRAAEVRDIVVETPRVKSFLLDVPDWPGHLPGQHVDIRLTAEDGYQAQRSYSIASAPESELLELTVERVEGGEVSEYFIDELRPGDRFELRGPIGGYFVWTAATEGPLLLLGGGSGIVPLMAMLRHRKARGIGAPAALIYSSRGFDDIIYRNELVLLSSEDPQLTVYHTLTRRQPPGWEEGNRRIDRAMIEAAAFPPIERPSIYICGSNPFVETAARLLVAIGHEPSRIKTERFGPSGS